MGIKGFIKKAGGKAADAVAKLSVLSPEQLRDMQERREEYLNQVPSMDDTAAEELTKRLLAASSIEIYNEYLQHIRDMYVPVKREIEYDGSFSAAHNIRFFNITKWVTDKKENSLEKLVNVYQVLSDENCNIALVFNRTCDATNVFLAVVNTDNADDNVDVENYRKRLAEAIRGNFPGAEWTDKNGTGVLPCLKNSLPYSVASASNIPGEKSEKFISQTKVLRNSFYCGIMTYHKYYCPDYLKQNRVKNMGEIEMTYTKGTHEPIVTEEEFNLVQARMDARTRQLNNCPKGKRVAPKREPATIWGKLMKCSCGCKFNQRGWNHHNGADEMAFQCYSKLAHGSVTERKKRGLPTKDTCTTPIIPKWKMELIAHEIFTKHFTDISAVTELACKMIEEHINDVEDVEDNTEIIAQKNAEIEKLERKKVGLIEMRADGDIERDYFLMRKDEVEKQIECLRQEIQELTPIDTRQKKENLVERLEALKQKLSEYTDFENTLIIPDGVIEAFTEQIIASDKGFDWYLKAVPDMVKSFMDDTPDDETEKEWHELTQFDLTIEDAKAYVYSFSSRRRVHGWQNIKIRLFV